MIVLLPKVKHIQTRSIRSEESKILSCSRYKDKLLTNLKQQINQTNIKLCNSEWTTQKENEEQKTL